jgi:hypothetical protein
MPSHSRADLEMGAIHAALEAKRSSSVEHLHFSRFGMALQRAAQIAIKHPAATNGAGSVSDTGAVVAVAFQFSCRIFSARIHRPGIIPT